MANAKLQVLVNTITPPTNIKKFPTEFLSGFGFVFFWCGKGGKGERGVLGNEFHWNFSFLLISALLFSDIWSLKYIESLFPTVF